MTAIGAPGTPRSSLLAVGPTAVDTGKLVISAAKALKPFAAADPIRTALLYRSWEAGRIGLLAFALRHQGRISRARDRARIVLRVRELPPRSKAATAVFLK